MDEVMTTAKKLAAFARELESQGAFSFEDIEFIVRDAAHALIYGDAYITVNGSSVKK